ncbi:MAG: VCBS domain-containing protein [Synergistaceae bacterium]
MPLTRLGYDDGSSDTTIVAGNVLTNDTDIDHLDTRTVTGVEAGTHGSATGNVAASVDGTYGSVVINADGTYSYTLDNTKGYSTSTCRW